MTRYRDDIIIIIYFSIGGCTNSGDLCSSLLLHASELSERAAVDAEHWLSQREAKFVVPSSNQTRAQNDCHARNMLGVHEPAARRVCDHRNLWKVQEARRRLSWRHDKQPAEYFCFRGNLSGHAPFNNFVPRHSGHGLGQLVQVLPRVSFPIFGCVFSVLFSFRANLWPGVGIRNRRILEKWEPTADKKIRVHKGFQQAMLEVYPEMIRAVAAWVRANCGAGFTSDGDAIRSLNRISFTGHSL